MARTIKAVFETSWNGAKAKETMEFPDEATDDEIDEAVSDWASSYYSWGWGEVAPKNDQQ